MIIFFNPILIGTIITLFILEDEKVRHGEIESFPAKLVLPGSDRIEFESQ